MKRLLLLFVWCVSAGAAPRHSMKNNFGAICLGPDLAKVPDKNIFLQVNDGERVKFTGNKGQIAVTNLNLLHDHTIHVYKGDTEVKKFKVNFDKIGTNFIILWRSPKKWSIYPVGGQSCVWPPPSLKR